MPAGDATPETGPLVVMTRIRALDASLTIAGAAPGFKLKPPETIAVMQAMAAAKYGRVKADKPPVRLIRIFINPSAQTTNTD